MGLYSPLKSMNTNMDFLNNLFPMQVNNSLYIFAKELDLPLPVFPNIPMCELNIPFIGM